VSCFVTAYGRNRVWDKEDEALHTLNATEGFIFQWTDISSTVKVYLLSNSLVIAMQASSSRCCSSGSRYT
jgi:hypothetical protein